MTSEKRSGDADVPVVKKRDTAVSKGVAHLKAEYIVFSKDKDAGFVPDYDVDEEPSSDRMLLDIGASDSGKKRKKNKQKKTKGQNKNRDNRQVKELNALCPKYIQGISTDNACTFGGQCRFVHDIPLYLSTKKPEIETEYFTECPVYKSIGHCPMGFKCRFLSSHLDKDSMQLLKSEEEARSQLWNLNHEVNHISSAQKIDLVKKRFPFSKSEEVLDIIDAIQQEFRDVTAPKKQVPEEQEEQKEKAPQVIQREKELQDHRSHQRDLYLKYKDTRYFAQEKNKLDLHHKKIVSPLTTVGNLPYRRLMKKLGADVTYSEMALGVPLIQGTNSEWALPKAHLSEFPGFGVQIACSKAWQAAKAAEALVANTDGHISEINLNSGCPIDLLYRQGSGSALLDNPARMIRCLNAMSYVSETTPVTVKIRTGTKDEHPMAESLVKRLVNETEVAAITLHGRSRQQRYTKMADWDYISKVADTLRDCENDFSDRNDGRERNQRIQFVGNGDVNNFEDWYRHIQSNDNIDSVMVARGALIKPWIFEEVDAQQHLDKSSKERLDILKDYSQFAMEHWGTDEYGISQCRRFFCEFMSFFHRYIPMGICERYPVHLNERPPNWKGRNDLETMLGSTNVQDWITLSELFFGKTDDSFVFMPKHKSNSYSN